MVLAVQNTGSIISIDTLFCAVIVLAVLLLIALIYLASIKSFLKNNQPVNAGSSMISSGVQATGNGSIDLAGNQELVAVITAAIYASMEGNVPADGLVVRSIRKVK